MQRVKWILSTVIVVIVVFIAAIIIFNRLDARNPVIKMEKHPYWISTLPSFNPDLIFVMVSNEQYRRSSQLEIWQLSSKEKIDSIDIGMNVARSLRATLSMLSMLSL